MDCPQFLDVAAELALGSLSGHERAAAIAHLETCPACQGEVDHLTAVADTLVGLAPDVEPPVGFERRVMERVGVEAGADRHRGLVARTNRRVAFVVVASLAAAAAGGWALGVSLQGAPGSPLLSGAPSAGAQSGDPVVEAAFTSPAVPGAPAAASVPMTIGHIWSYWGHPAWMFMSVDDPAVTGVVSCQLLRADGAVVGIGSFRVDGGRGWWGVPVNLARGQVTQARLVDSSGHILGTAALTGTRLPQ